MALPVSGTETIRQQWNHRNDSNLKRSSGEMFRNLSCSIWCAVHPCRWIDNVFIDPFVCYLLINRFVNSPFSAFHCQPTGSLPPFQHRINGPFFNGMSCIFISIDSSWTDLQLCFCVGGHQVKFWICFGFLKVQLVVWDLISVPLSTQLSPLNFNVI